MAGWLGGGDGCRSSRRISASRSCRITASDAAAEDLFGASVAVEGDTVVVGASEEVLGVNPPGQGSAYVFVKSAVGWAGPLNEDAKLTASDGAERDGFGQSVAVHGDTALVGARGDDIGGKTNQGSAYLFAKPPAGWAGVLTENAKLSASDGDGFDLFGISVAMGGGTLLAGAVAADRDDIGHLNQGAVYLFNLSELSPAKPARPQVACQGSRCRRPSPATFRRT